MEVTTQLGPVISDGSKKALGSGNRLIGNHHEGECNRTRILESSSTRLIESSIEVRAGCRIPPQVVGNESRDRHE